MLVCVREREKDREPCDSLIVYYSSFQRKENVSYKRLKLRVSVE